MRCLVLALMLTACSVAPPASTETRIVSLQPQITETLFAIGAGDLVVGRSDYDALPSEVTALPSAGTALTPNVEAVVGLRPSLVLVAESAGTRLDLLEPIATVEALPWFGVSDVGASIRRLGELTDHAAEAETVALQLLASLQEAPPATGPKTLLVYASDDLATGPVWFVQRNSLHGAAMHAAGLVNAVEEDVTGAPSLPVEQLLAVNPEWIVILSSDSDLSDSDRERLAHSFDALTPLSAVKNGQIRVLAGGQYHSTGPSLSDFVGVLRLALTATEPAR
ncbi:MAG: ABC-type Fe3+-hydroxamate transport system substrate-binding protein [Myxococcota bacterium]|jgi:ABC-type Fe3+-hydroxamate transport system substrate-binding protein